MSLFAKGFAYMQVSIAKIFPSKRPFRRGIPFQGVISKEAVKPWSTFSERLKLNVEKRWFQGELLCMFKTFFSGPAFSSDHRRSLAFTQRSSGAIPATMDDYQRLFHAFR